jgi:hypothetical protein
MAFLTSIHNTSISWYQRVSYDPKIISFIMALLCSSVSSKATYHRVTQGLTLNCTWG